MTRPREANKILPNSEHKLAFLEALAELEDNSCYVKREFPKTRLHRVTGVEEAIYRTDLKSLVKYPKKINKTESK